MQLHSLSFLFGLCKPLARCQDASTGLGTIAVRKLLSHTRKWIKEQHSIRATSTTLGGRHPWYELHRMDRKNCQVTAEEKTRTEL